MGLVLPTYLSKWTTSRVVREGVTVKPAATILGITQGAGGLVVELENGETVLADHLVLAVGLAPNTDLAIKSGLEVDKTNGGILGTINGDAGANLKK